MEWLKAILEKAKPTEDGKLDVSAVMNAIQKEFPNHAVPKTEFNSKTKELKAANETIAELKKENGENEALQKKVEEYKGKISAMEKSAAEAAKTYALKEQLQKQGVLDPDYLIFKQGGIEKFAFDEENHPVDIEEVLKPYREDKAMGHLFKQGQSYKPQGGEAGGNMNPFAKETFNLTKQGELFRSDPEQAKALAASAGVKI